MPALAPIAPVERGGASGRAAPGKRMTIIDDDAGAKGRLMLGARFRP